MTTRTPFTIGLVQMAMDADPVANMDKAIAKLSEAAKAGATIICLPELFRSHYFCQQEDPDLFDLAEPIPGPSTEALGKLAKSLGVTIVASLFERRAPGLHHNTTAVLCPDGGLGIYRKMHIPDDPGYYEKYYFTPGDLGFKTFDTPSGRIGVLICWDQWYPEAARITALLGATVLFYPTAIGWHPYEKKECGQDQYEAWQTVQRGHAVANGLYVAAVNRVGHETPPSGGPGIEFWGSSFVADPMGKLVAKASHDAEETIYAEIDPAKIENTRRNWPFLRDRRIDAYHGIDRRYLADRQS